MAAPTTGTKDLGMRGGGGTVMSAGRPMGNEDEAEEGFEENSDSEAVLACGSELLDQTLTGGGGATAAAEAALEAGEEAPADYFMDYNTG